jgi:uncharacterized membrane protein YtjA (UPF0391 family)
MNSALLRKALAFLVIAIVAVLAFKVLIAIVLGIAHTLFALALLVVVVIAVLWALRKL